MRTTETSTVYAAELQGINLALVMVRTSITAGNSHKNITVFTDN
jgi:hypothetical protein